MVEVSDEKNNETVPLESSSTSGKDSLTNSTNQKQNEDGESSDGWNPLMGKDIQLKDLSTGGPTSGKECQPQDAVVIDFVGRLANDRDEESGPIFHEAKDCLIVVGEKFVCPALEMGVRFMHVGQRAVIWAHSKFAYGLSTRKHMDFELPPNSNVRYEIVVKSIYSPDEESSDPDGFQIKLALSKKQIANDMFKNELYGDNYGGEQRTLRLYNKAAEEMLHLIQNHATKKQEDGDAYNEEDGKKKTEQAFEIMLDCLNNIAAVYMKSKQYHEAKEAAVKVLGHDPDNIKALLRAARAAMLDPAGTYEEADLAIAAAERVVEEKEWDNKDIRKLRAELKQKKHEYKQRQKEMAAKMQKGMRQAKTESQSLKSDSDKKQLDPKEEVSEALPTEELSSEEATTDTALRRKLLPYALQIVFPVLLYYLIVWATKKSGQINNDDQQPTPEHEMQEEL